MNTNVVATLVLCALVAGVRAQPSNAQIIDRMAEIANSIDRDTHFDEWSEAQDAVEVAREMEAEGDIRRWPDYARDAHTRRSSDEDARPGPDVGPGGEETLEEIVLSGVIREDRIVVLCDHLVGLNFAEKYEFALAWAAVVLFHEIHHVQNDKFDDMKTPKELESCWEVPAYCADIEFAGFVGFDGFLGDAWSDGIERRVGGKQRYQ